MRNLIKTLVMIAVFLMAIGNAKAVTYNVRNEGDLGVKLHLELKDEVKEVDMAKLYSSDTNDYVYSMTPDISSQSGIYQEVEQISSLDIGLDYDDFLAISKYSLYGYNFPGHLSDEWYMATQYLIWDYIVEKNGGEIYFVDVNGEKIDLYNEEIEGIYQSIREETDYPSFVGKKFDLRLDQKLEVEDTKGVMEKFNFTIYDTTGLNVEGNTLTFVPEHGGDFAITCRRKLPTFKTSSQIMKSNRGDVLLLRGMTNTDFQFIEVKVRNPYVTLVSKDGKDLTGAVYAIYDEMDNELFSMEFRETSSEMLELFSGKFSLKLVKTPNGYYENTERIYFEVGKSDTEIEVDLKPIKRNVVVDSTMGKAGVEFKIIDAKKGIVVQESSTNKEGVVTFDVTYGDYIVRAKDKSTAKEFKDLRVIVNDGYNEGNVFSLEKKEIIGGLYLEKRDLDTKELILLPTKFRIKNVTTGEYFKLNGSEVIVMNEGVLRLHNLVLGNYKLEEIEAPEGYRALKNEIMFQISEDESMVRIVVYNEIQKGSLAIKKLESKKGNAIPDVKFNIYDEDKEILWTDKTNSEGILEYIDIPAGVYYVGEEDSEELVQVDIKDNVVSQVNFRDEEILGSSSDGRVEIEVPATGKSESMWAVMFTLVWGVISFVFGKKKY